MMLTKHPKRGRPSLGPAKRTRLSMTLKPDLVARLEARAQGSNRSVSNLVEELLEACLLRYSGASPVKTVHLEKMDRARLRDMRHYALQARTFSAGKTEAAFYRDRLTQRACERSIGIIGEAASHVSAEARELCSHIPFDALIAMRDKLSKVDSKAAQREVWKTLRFSIPALLQALDKGPDIS